MENLIVDLINRFTYLAVFILICIENIFPPIPSEIILTFAGFVSLTNDLNFIFMVISATLGSWIGAELLYLLGYYLQPEKFEKLLVRFKFDMKHIDSANKWFKKYGSLTVFLCRFIPIIRSLISIPAGMSKMKHLPFMIYTIVGSLIWNIVLIYIGYMLGENYYLIEVYMQEYKVIVFAILGLVAIVYLFIKIRMKRKNDRA